MTEEQEMVRVTLPDLFVGFLARKPVLHQDYESARVASESWLSEYVVLMTETFYLLLTFSNKDYAIYLLIYEKQLIKSISPTTAPSCYLMWTQGVSV